MNGPFSEPAHGSRHNLSYAVFVVQEALDAEFEKKGLTARTFASILFS